MKKHLVALAALTASGMALAQSSVTVYGMVDAAVTHISGGVGSAQTLLMDGGSDTSRLGFRGTEDLGGGLKAKFEIEGQIDATNGTGGIANRQSWVSLSGNSWGEVRMGRDYNGGFLNSASYNPWIANGVGQGISLTTRLLENLNAANNGRDFTRNNNSISYILPSTLGGFYGNFQLAFGDRSKGNLGKSNNFRVGYQAGPMDLALGYENYSGDSTGTTASRDMKSINVAGSYDLGVLKLMGYVGTDDYENPVTGAKIMSLNNLELSAVIPLGKGKIRASYGRAEYDNVAGADPVAHKYAVGYVYDLSKRTSLYTSYGHVNNKNGATVPVHFAGPAAQAGRSMSGFDVGLLHVF